MSSSSRQIARAGNFIIKSPKVSHPIPYIESLEELKASRNSFDEETYYSMLQTWNEIEIYENASREERSYLAPVCHIFYDYKNIPHVVFPYIVPLMTPEEAAQVEEDDEIFLLQNFLLAQGLSDQQVEEQINGLYETAEELGIVDIFENLSNLGITTYGRLVILDYGLTQEEIDDGTFAVSAQ